MNGRQVEWRGNHLNLLMDHLHWSLESYAPYYGDGKVILDVGGSFGIFASTAAYFCPEAEIYSFEPAKESNELFEKNCSSDPRIHLIKKAVGEDASTLHFTFDSAHPEGSQILRAAADGSYEVEQTTLDEFVERTGIERIDLLKIDVEGFEIHVLNGATETLRRTRYAVIEISTARGNVPHVVEAMEQAGFQIIDFGEVNRSMDSLANTVDSFDLVFASEH